MDQTNSRLTVALREVKPTDRAAAAVVGNACPPGARVPLIRVHGDAMHCAFGILCPGHLIGRGLDLAPT